MKRILFICHGNICRSPMAEFVMKQLVATTASSFDWEIASAAVSTEETGNDMYPPAKRKLTEKGVPFGRREARQMTREDYRYYDYIICMDKSNVRLMKYIVGDDTEGKVSLLMHWAGIERDVADPWYTGDFETTYNDVVCGCKAVLKSIDK